MVTTVTNLEQERRGRNLGEVEGTRLVESFLSHDSTWL